MSRISCIIAIVGLICIGFTPGQIFATSVFTQDFSSSGSESFVNTSTTNWNRGGYLQNLSRVSNELKVEYDSGSHYGGALRHYFAGADSTTYSYLTAETDYNELYLQFDFKFQNNFDIQDIGGTPNTKGGKIGGLAGRRNGGWGEKEPGTVVPLSDPEEIYEGWSSRMAFKEIDSGIIELMAYTYYYDTPDSVGLYGDNIIVDTVNDNTWYTIKMHVKMNTGAYKNGKLRVWINGVLKLDRSDIQYIDDTDARITELWLDSYFGGGETSPQTQYVYYDNVSVATTEGDLKPVVAQPRAYVLHDNYPNPFNPETTISFLVPQPAPVKIDIYNVMGQQIATLLNSTVETGYHEATWNGTDRSGKRVADGVYFYRMEADGYVQSRKMLLLK